MSCVTLDLPQLGLSDVCKEKNMKDFNTIIFHV